MRLAVNIDHIATLRNARKEIEPDPVHAALLAELAGAEGIVCHLREDRRHINDDDLRRLRESVKTKLDLEMAMTQEMGDIAIMTSPDLVTLVPEKRAELTTEGGLDVLALKGALIPFVARLSAHSIPTSVFIEPEITAVKAAHDCGAMYVEFHTGKYAGSKGHVAIAHELARIRSAANEAHRLGLRVNAGHGLNYYNIAPIARIPEIEEVSIGHALIARAALLGIETAVRDMIALLRAH